MSATRRSQAVHVVEKIEGVAQSGKPNGADQRVAAWKGAIGLDTRKRKHEERANGERGHQLRDQRQLQPVVEADDEHRESGDKHADHSTMSDSRTGPRTQR